MFGKSWRTLWLLSMAMAVLSTAAWADTSHVRVVRLSYVNGSVEMDRATGDGFQPALLNMPVVYQSRIRTGDDGEAELEFEDGSTVRLTPDTEIAFTDLSVLDSGTKVTRIDFERGMAYIDWKHKDDRQLYIDFRGKTLSLKKDSHFRIAVNGDDNVEVAMFKGNAVVDGGAQGEVAVKSDETLKFDSSDAQRYFLAREVQSGAYDSWDKDRDDIRAELAAKQRQYIPAEYSYGSALSSYGDWVTVPVYGAVWQPFGFGPTWDPFASGAWAWYPGWGWQWVSAYPWGWLPYHYGHWVFINGRGWCWSRPQHWGGWQPVVGVARTASIAAKGNGGAPPPIFRKPEPPAAPTGNGRGVTLIRVGAGPALPGTASRDHRVPGEDGGPRPRIATGSAGSATTNGGTITPAQSFQGGGPGLREAGPDGVITNESIEVYKRAHGETSAKTRGTEIDHAPPTVGTTMTTGEPTVGTSITTGQPTVGPTTAREPELPMRHSHQPTSREQMRDMALSPTGAARDMSPGRAVSTANPSPAARTRVSPPPAAAPASAMPRSTAPSYSPPRISQPHIDSSPRMGNGGFSRPGSGGGVGRSEGGKPK